MCFRYNHELTKTYKSKDEPIKLYKCYQLSTKKPKPVFISPFRVWDATVFLSATEVIAKHPEDWTSSYVHVIPLSLEADGKIVQTRGLHCFLTKDTADVFADAFNDKRVIDETKVFVFEVESHTKDIFAVGSTPGHTSLDCPKHRDTEFPTVISTKINITQEEYNRVTALLKDNNVYR